MIKEICSCDEEEAEEEEHEFSGIFDVFLK